jgi:hypothetical protein
MNPDTNIAVSLTASEWNVVLQLLAEGPYRVAAPLISAIQKQAMESQNAAPPAPAPNGAQHAPN